MSTIVSVWLALTLAAGATLKAARAGRSGAALATYGISRAPVQRALVWTLISLELGLAGALLTGVPGAATALAALFFAFALLTAAALLAGRRGSPCACFGSASRLGSSSPLRALVLAGTAGVLALGWLPQAPSGYGRWLTLGLSLGIAAITGLALAVLALAREVGVLRLQMSSRGALEIPEEGPELGMAQSWSATVPSPPGALMRLAIFTSEGCPLCRRVAPAVAHVAADPLLAVRLLDELADEPAWRQAQVPGSPYAVALDRDGVALAKGTFNSLAQLESIVATARLREGSVPLAA
jgi:hypothetical protein